MTDAYNSDGNCYRSPLLKPQIVDYEIRESLSVPSLSESKKRSRSRGVRPSIGDAVLLGSYLEPNRPDISNYATDNLLLPDSSSEDKDLDDGEVVDNNDESKPEPESMNKSKQAERKPEPKAKQEPEQESGPSEALPISERIAQQALEVLGSPRPEELPAERGANNLSSREEAYNDRNPPRSTCELSLRTDLAALQQNNQSDKEPLHVQIASKHRASDDIPENSPLKKYAIPPSERSAQELLPALQSFHSPPQSATTNSPDNNNNHHHNLPSLQSALGEQLSEAPPPKEHPTRISSASAYSLPSVSGSSPSLPRKSPVREQVSRPIPPPQFPLSPYSHISPASSNDIPDVPSSAPALQMPSWNPALKPGMRQIASNCDALSSQPSQPSQTANSAVANGYPTPTGQKGVAAVATTADEQSLPVNNAVPSHVPISIMGGYRCEYPGCDAPPFQTHYLLSSHANVHSQERPHFCSVPGCPRGIGGKGFKRKNEMIRHGLVHDSPGYVCPFCPQQQHRYPRPDNLQRHVRVHHVDKPKNDPELRKVLARRPEGSARGRRRRVDT